MESQTEGPPDATALYRLKSVGATHKRGRMAVILEFDSSGHPPVKFLRENRPDVKILTVQLASTVFEEVALPHFERPLVQVQLQGFEKADTSKLNIVLYFETQVDPEMKRIGDTLEIGFSWDPLPAPKAVPVKLENIEYNSFSPEDVVLKFQFDDVPGERRAFLSKDRKSVVAIFHNTLVNSKTLVLPRLPLVPAITLQQESSLDGVPMTRIVFDGSIPLLLEMRTDDYRVFLDLNAQTREDSAGGDPSVVQELLSIAPAKRQTIARVTPSDSLRKPSGPAQFPDTTGQKPAAADASDAPAATQAPQGEKRAQGTMSSKVKKWVWLGMGATILAGGAFGTWVYLQEENLQGNAIIPGPENEVIFPTEPR